MFGNVLSQKTEEGKLKSITLRGEDGSETVINLTDNVCLLFGFMATPSETKTEVTGMELLVHGRKDVVAEMYFQLGEIHSELVKYCVMRSAQTMIERAQEKMKAQGIDPLTEALKKMTPPEGRPN